MKDDQKFKLTTYEDLLTTEENRTDHTGDMVMEIPLSELCAFKNHPFKVQNDEKMREMAESVREYGVLVPAMARPKADGGYELISGHRRKRACELAGLGTMPVIVRDLDDDAAACIMVDSNLQRENILPSEKAFAYRMKLEAIKRQGERRDLNLLQVGTKFRADETVAESVGESARGLQRYIRLTELIPELLNMVDQKKLTINPAVELSFLGKDEQRMLLEIIGRRAKAPTLAQAKQLKELSREGLLDKQEMVVVLTEKKQEVLTLSGALLRELFPESYTPRQMEETIIKLVEAWYRKRTRSQER